MRNIIKTALLVATLTGCSAAQQQTANQIIQDAQQASVVACSFLPTAATIAGIISANPAIATATQIATIICGALQPKTNTKALRRLAAPAGYSAVVNGQVVPIHGKFVK